MTRFVKALLSSGAESSTAAFIESKSVRCGNNNNNRFFTPAFDQKIIAVALTLCLNRSLIVSAFC